MHCSTARFWMQPVRRFRGFVQRPSNVNHVFSIASTRISGPLVCSTPLTASQKIQPREKISSIARCCSTKGFPSDFLKA